MFGTLVLAALEPILVERFVALACADSAAAGRLLKGMSSGPFTKKWGALPVALWLLADQTVDKDALHRIATGGPFLRSAGWCDLGSGREYPGQGICRANRERRRAGA